MTEGLGSIICTTPQCTDGAASVQAMDDYFQMLDPSTKAIYQNRHDAIIAQFQEAYSWYSPYIPFNPACCTVQTIGQGADALLCEMQGGQGCVSPSSGGDGMSLQAMIVLAAVGYLAFVYVVNKR